MAHDDRPVVLGLSIAFAIIAIASVVFRFEARRIKRLRLEADDWTILAAMVLSLAVTVDLLIGAWLGNVNGAGLTISDPRKSPENHRQYSVFSKTIYVFELLVWPCVGLTKISVLLLYKRIFGTRNFRRVVWFLIGFAVAWTVTMELVSLLSCLPISSRWDLTKEPSCIDKTSFYTAALTIDVVTDGLILLLPIYKIRKLQMAIHRKLAIVGMFGFGALVTVTGIVRLHYVTAADGSVPLQLLRGISDSFYPAVYWSIIEINVGILSACLPTLRPLYKGYRINSIVSKLSSICRGSRPTAQLGDNIRLSSVEDGLSSNVSKVRRSHTTDPLAVYDDLESPAHPPEVLPHHKMDQSLRSSEESV